MPMREAALSASDHIRKEECQEWRRKRVKEDGKHCGNHFIAAKYCLEDRRAVCLDQGKYIRLKL